MTDVGQSRESPLDQLAKVAIPEARGSGVSTPTVCPHCKGAGTVVKNGPHDDEYDNLYPCPCCTTSRTALKGTGRVCRGCGGPLAPSTGHPRIWCSDACRKRTLYSGVCVDCGAKTNGSNGRGPHAPKRCKRCAHLYEHETRRWTPDAVVAALRQWARDLGRPPTAADAAAAGTPVPQMIVQREFGSWNAGIKAAGFRPRRVGEHGPSYDLDLCREIADRYASGESSRSLADVYGCSEETIRFRVRKAGGTLRPPGVVPRSAVPA